MNQLQKREMYNEAKPVVTPAGSGFHRLKSSLGAIFAFLALE